MREPKDIRVGIDVGGTNTDAVVLDAEDNILAWTKEPTTDDVTTGLRGALGAVLEQLAVGHSRIGRIMLGTTHATNAILERRGLGRVGVIRVGAPATTSVPPLVVWPADLREAVVAGTTIVRGGHFVDGSPIAPLDLDAVRSFLDHLKGTVDAMAITAVFSPSSPDHERAVAEVVAEMYGADFPVSIGSEIGSLGLLERENATVLNAALYGVAGEVTSALAAVLEERQLDVASFFAQNDGTLMAVEYAAHHPVLTIGSGPANSIRGAAFLSRLPDAIIADVGGTSTDIGVLVNGFPRESAAAVEIGGVRTNFRMPDILSVAIGGGTIVRDMPDGVRVGPESLGYLVTRDGIVFGGTVPTITDAAVLAGRGRLGDTRRLTKAGLGADLLELALAASDEQIAEAVDQMSIGRVDRPLVVVGGGAFILPDKLPGVTDVLRPDHGNVANAVGAGIALVSGVSDTVIAPGEGRRAATEEACEMAIERAVRSGADPSKVEIVEIAEIPLSYFSQPAIRLQVKAAGPLGWL